MSAPRLHARVASRADHRMAIREKLTAIAAERQRLSSLAPLSAPVEDSIEVDLSTVSLNTNFDAQTYVRFKGGSLVGLTLDSGNTCLIMPDYDSLSAQPNFATDFQVLADNVTEPWGAQACLLRGPIEIPTTTAGEVFTVPDCVFFACKGLNSSGEQSTNFGLGCVSVWPSTAGFTTQAPLTYNTDYPFAEVNYAAAATVLAASASPTVVEGSTLTLSNAQPPGYQMFAIIPGKQWMALTPTSLTIGGVKTSWPSGIAAPIAMVDTGGGPVYLSDPAGDLYTTVWPEQVGNPAWIDAQSISCQSVRDDLVIELGDGASTYVYSIAPTQLPPSAQNLTLVICQKCYYMMEEAGMNIGGVSALLNSILIDYGSQNVGFKPRVPTAA